MAKGPDEPEERPPRGNRLRARAKYDEATFVRLVYFFCNGVPIKIAARNTALSAKTVRSVYIDLRKRLLEPAFNRWHGTSQRLLALTAPDEEFAARTLYLDALARCAGNESCARNYRLGNRKKRQCRTCPLAAANSDEPRAEAYAVIDAVHDFYERLGIRGEKDIPPAILFRERLIHTAVIGTVHANSRRLQSGFFDPSEETFTSGGPLLRLFFANLTAPLRRDTVTLQTQ